MSEYTHSANDLKSLIGQQLYTGYVHQQQEHELLVFQRIRFDG
jgi:hypothetical protein